jgi:N-acetylneuraminate lyase
MSAPLTGLIAAAHTPMNDDGSLNLDLVEVQAEHYSQTGVSGAFIAGTTGEGYSLSQAERKALAQRWCEVGRDAPLRVIIHAGSNCQRDACELASHAHRAGVDAVAVMAPFYFKPAGVDALVDFCVPIAAAAGDLPFYLYDVPLLTGVRLSMVDFLRRGKRQIPTLRGLKYTNEDLAQFQQCIRLGGGEFDILFGRDEALLAGWSLGARGAVGSTYNFAAPLYHDLIRAYQSGDLETARTVQAKSVEMVATIAQYGFPAAAKAVMRILGIDCGPARPPLRNLTADQQRELAERLRALDVLAPGPAGRSVVSD